MRFRTTALILCFGGALAAQTSSLTASVVTSTGAPVAGAAVQLNAGAFSATTNALGQFTITGLRNQVYLLQVDPVAPTLAARELNVTVNSATSLGNIVVSPGALVSGTVVDPTGAPLFSANLNVYQADGTKLYTPSDGTDAAGNFAIVAPLAAVTIEVLPPVGTTLFAWRGDVTLTGPLTFATITLPQGYLLTGTVVRSGAAPLPISACAIAVVDQFTELEVPVTNNLTNSLGAFSVLLPFGLYRLDLVPPTANLHTPRQMFGVAVLGQNRSLGFVGLDPAVVLSGTVAGPAGAIASADIDIFDALGHKLFTPNDNTNGSGLFSVRVPTGGSYAVRVDPPPQLGVSGLKTNIGLVAAARNLGTLTLAAGIPITLDMFDVRGQPIADLNLRLNDPITGAEVIVPGNNTDAAGRMVAIVPPGLFDVSLRPPQGNVAATVTVPGVPFVASFAVPLTLPDKTVRTDLAGYPTLGVANGGDILLDWTIANQTLAQQQVTVEAFVALASGVEVPWIAPLPLDLPPQFAIGLQFWFPTPVLDASQLRWEQRFQLRLRDAATQAILDDAYVYYFPN